MKISRSIRGGHPVYIATASIQERKILAEIGFNWDSHNLQWWTKRKSIAAILSDYADESCCDELSVIAKPNSRIIEQIDFLERKRWLIVKLPTGSVIVKGVAPMLSEDGTEIPANQVASLYQLTADLPVGVDLGSFLSTHGTLVAQCSADDWPTAVTALTAEDNEEEVI